MAENLLSDAKVRAAARERDGLYLRDGGGLRIRLLEPSRRHPKGARLAEFEYKLRAGDGRRVSHTLHLGTIGEPFAGADGQLRPFTLADARRARDAARGQVARGVDPRAAERLARLEEAEAARVRLAELEARRTVRQAFEQWEALYLQARARGGGPFLHRKDGGAEVRETFGRHVLPTLGARPLEDVRRADVAAVLDELVAAGKRRTANGVLALMRQFVRWCAARDWIQRDPTLALAKRDFGGAEPPRERNLSELEIVELRDKLPAAKLPERIQAAVWLALATGVRIGELSGARVSEFDLEAAEWRLPAERVKNGDAFTLHLSPFAVRHTRRLIELADGSEWLLPGRDKRAPVSSKLVAKMLNDRQRPAPLKGRSKAAATLLLARGKWSPHDLRRTMASRMGDLGIAPHVIERCLNHRPEGIRAVYQRSELLPERRAAFDQWGAKLERLLATDAANVVELEAHRPATRAVRRGKAA